MGKLFAVIRREYLERVRNKWFVIVTVFGPVFFAAIMILPAALSVRGIRNAKVDDLRIIDASGAGLGARVAERLTRPPRDSVAAKAFKAPAVIIDTVPVDGVASAEAALITQVQAKTLAGYLVVDTATLARGAARYAGRNASSIGENERVETALRSALLGYRMEVAGLDSAASESITALRVRLATERITDEGKSGSGIAGMIFGLVVAMLLYMSIILYGQAIMRGVLEEKTSRVAEVIVASVKPEVLLAGKVIGVGAVGLTRSGSRAASSSGVSAPSSSVRWGRTWGPVPRPPGARPPWRSPSPPSSPSPSSRSSSSSCSATPSTPRSSPRSGRW
jgi:ABC-2 type transport system permease protein